MKDTTKGILGALAAFAAAWSTGKALGRKLGQTTYTTKREYGKFNTGRGKEEKKYGKE